MKGLLRLLPLLALLVAFAGAQQRLVVNGAEVAGLTTELVSGTSYTLAGPYARAVGAVYRLDAGARLASFEYGGRLITLRVFEDPQRAASAERALTVGGRSLESPGAVALGDQVYVPVKSLSRALGGETAYLTEARTVAVVFPRAELVGVAPPGVWGDYERFVLSFSAPVTLEAAFEPSLLFVRFRFPRAVVQSGTPRFTRGRRFTDAAFVADASYLDFNLNLAYGTLYSYFSEPYGGGTRVVIDLFSSGVREEAREAPPIVLDPGEGTLGLARRLQGALQKRGRRVQLTWARGAPDLEARRRAGVGASLFISLSRAPVAPGRFNLYYLADSAELTPEIRLAARTPREAALSADSRALLERLTPDLARGEELARRLRRGLERRTELRLKTLMGAPLFILTGAAGRGVMLELSPEDLTEPGLVPALAEALAASGAP